MPNNGTLFKDWKNSVAKLPGGRPSKYKPEYCKKLIDHMSTGMSYETFSAEADVNLDTLYEWEKVHKEYSEAKREAFRRCQHFWEKAGLDGLVTKNGKSLNSAVWIFNMKNRFKWRDLQEVEQKTESKVEVTSPQLDSAISALKEFKE